MKQIKRIFETSLGTISSAKNQARALVSIAAYCVMVMPSVARGSDLDPFNPMSCDGEPMTAQEALSHINVPGGVLEKGIGRFTIYRRSRDCYDGFPCSPWRNGGADFYGKSPYGETNFSSYEFSTSPKLTLKSTGGISMKYESNQPTIKLTGDVFSDSWGAFWWSKSFISQQVIFTGINPTLENAQASGSIAWDYGPSRGCPNGECEPPKSYTGNSPLEFADKPFVLKGKVTRECLRLTTSTASIQHDTNNNQYTYETEVVLMGDIPSSCDSQEQCQAQGE